MAPLYSEDGRWWWDGARWRPRVVEGEPSLFWLAETPDWAGRVLVIGLIGLIPVAGSMVVYGWLLTVADRLRQGWRELPEPGFQFLERGVRPFLAFLVYGLAAFAAIFVAVAAALLMGVAFHPLIVLSVLIGLAALAAVPAYALLSAYCLLAVLAISDRLGVAAALRPREVWRAARANHALSLRGGLIYGLSLLALIAVSAPVSIAIPLGGLLAGLGLPAVFAMVAPSLAAFRLPSGQESAPSIA